MKTAPRWRVEAKIKEVLRAEEGEIEQGELSDAVTQDLDDEGFEVQPETLQEAYAELAAKDRIAIDDRGALVFVSLV
jgi:hypothetical protein